MKKFNLDEYLKNPARKVVTGVGRNVRILCTDRRNSGCPIVALIEDEDKDKPDEVRTFTIDGNWSVAGDETPFDLFFAPERHEGWVNIFRGKDGPFAGDIIFNSKEDAEESSGHYCGFTKDLYMTTVRVEWEE